MLPFLKSVAAIAGGSSGLATGMAFIVCVGVTDSDSLELFRVSREFNVHALDVSSCTAVAGFLVEGLVLSAGLVAEVIAERNHSKVARLSAPNLRVQVLGKLTAGPVLLAVLATGLESCLHFFIVRNRRKTLIRHRRILLLVHHLLRRRDQIDESGFGVQALVLDGEKGT